MDLTEFAALVPGMIHREINRHCLWLVVIWKIHAECVVVVQKQSNVSFNAISCGEFETANKINHLADGDCFDLNTQQKYYDDLIRHGALLDESVVQLSKVGTYEWHDIVC
jgi:hypothetical protein